MPALARTLVVLSAVLLAAHFSRAGLPPLAVAALLLPLLLLSRRAALTRVLRAGLALGAIEWLLTLAALVGDRRAAGRPFVRLAVILGSVALVTALAAWLAPRGRRAG